MESFSSITAPSSVGGNITEGETSPLHYDVQSLLNHAKNTTKAVLLCQKHLGSFGFDRDHCRDTDCPAGEEFSMEKLEQHLWDVIGGLQGRRRSKFRNALGHTIHAVLQ